MIAISCDRLRLSFGTDTVLRDVSFSLNEGEKLGIVGVNGAGKSTLLKLITGEYTADEGNVFIGKDKTVGMLSQNVGFDSERSIIEETEGTFGTLITMEAELETLRLAAEGGDEAAGRRYSTLHERFVKEGGYEFRSRCRGILKNLGFPKEQWNARISTLSGGQKTRLALTCLLLRDPDILLLDEPTNHLDVDAMFWLEEHLRSSRKTILVVSHDRYFLDRVATRILEIEHSRAGIYQGNYSKYAEQKRIDREIQMRHYRNQQKEIARIEAYIEQQRRWNREKNIIAAESRQKQLDKMERIERPENLPEQIRLQFKGREESGEDVMKVKRLSKSYPGRTLFRDVTFSLSRGERLFLTGENGCGKSTLIRMLAGDSEPETGEIEYGYHVSVGYYDQENQNLHPENTVLDELWNAYPNMTQTDVRSALALFQFKGDDIEKKVSVLSGGEKARLTLSKLILARHNLLILDEPTNHLDIGSREVLEEALEQFDGTLIAVSHDRYFIRRLASRIMDFSAKERYALFDYRGGYEDYLRYKREYLTPVEEETERILPPSASKEQYLINKQMIAEKRKRERRLEKIGTELEGIEKRIVEIDDELEASDGTDYVHLSGLMEEKEKLEESMLLLMEESEELQKQLNGEA